MKKTAKFLTLALALSAGTATAAQAADFKIGADLVSSYMFRGSEFGDSPAVQPAISYTFKDSGIVVGAWGSYAISANTTASKYRYQEVDLYATVPVGDLSFTVTNYYIPTLTEGSEIRSFDFTNDGPNTVEVSAAYAKDNLSLLAAINVAGLETKNAKYFEAGYKVYDKDGYAAKVVAGAGNENYYAGSTSTRLGLVNVGFSVAKDKYTGSYVYNPVTEKSNLVFMASF
ncbi:MAG: TorF family putative porin [Chlorobiaceae bacterium]